MEIQKYASKEMNRMKEITANLKLNKKTKLSLHFQDFALRYFKDGCYFYEKKQFVEAFEAFIISWSYIDAGLKLKFFQVPIKQKEWFTA